MKNWIVLVFFPFFHFRLQAKKEMGLGCTIVLQHNQSGLYLAGAAQILSFGDVQKTGAPILCRRVWLSTEPGFACRWIVKSQSAGNDWKRFNFPNQQDKKKSLVSGSIIRLESQLFASNLALSVDSKVVCTASIPRYGSGVCNQNDDLKLEFVQTGPVALGAEQALGEGDSVKITIGQGGIGGYLARDGQTPNLITIKNDSSTGADKNEQMKNQVWNIIVVDPDYFKNRQEGMKKSLPSIDKHTLLEGEYYTFAQAGRPNNSTTTTTLFCGQLTNRSTILSLGNPGEPIKAKAKVEELCVAACEGEKGSWWAIRGENGFLQKCVPKDLQNYFSTRFSLACNAIVGRGSKLLVQVKNDLFEVLIDDTGSEQLPRLAQKPLVSNFFTGEITEDGTLFYINTEFDLLKQDKNGGVTSILKAAFVKFAPFVKIFCSADGKNLGAIDGEGRLWIGVGNPVGFLPTAILDCRQASVDGDALAIVFDGNQESSTSNAVLTSFSALQKSTVAKPDMKKIETAVELSDYLKYLAALSGPNKDVLSAIVNYASSPEVENFVAKASITDRRQLWQYLDTQFRPLSKAAAVDTEAERKLNSLVDLAGKDLPSESSSGQSQEVKALREQVQTLAEKLNIANTENQTLKQKFNEKI